jgi:hypothetical protein
MPSPILGSFPSIVPRFSPSKNAKRTGPAGRYEEINLEKKKKLIAEMLSRWVYSSSTEKKEIVVITIVHLFIYCL